MRTGIQYIVLHQDQLTDDGMHHKATLLDMRTGLFNRLSPVLSLDLVGMQWQAQGR